MAGQGLKKSLATAKANKIGRHTQKLQRKATVDGEGISKWWVL